MPCRDYGSDSWQDPKSTYEYRRLKERADMLARIACKALTALEENGLEDFLILKDDEVRDWWIPHKEADQKRREEERILAEAKQRKENLKQQALSRLSDEEKIALGLMKKGK